MECAEGYRYAGQLRKGTFFSFYDKLRKMRRTLLKKGKIGFKNTGDVWEGEFLDFELEKGKETSIFKLVGTVKKKGEEKGRKGVWKCEDTGQSYRVLEYICDLGAWEKLEKKEITVDWEALGKEGEEEEGDETELVEVD